MAKPRCAHYQMAHVALRSVALRNPQEFLALLMTHKRRDFLASLLEQVAEHCADQPPDFTAEDLVLHPTRVLGSPCLVIEMPQPQVPPEAHLVAAWLAINDGPESAPLRFFTLEAADATFGWRTVLGEWDAKGEHMNLGQGPEPSVEAFVQAITAVVARYH